MRSLAVVVATVVLASAASCLIHRKSDDLKCDPSDDCGPGKMCDQGFCVDLGCPSVCTGGCDLANVTCNINCNSVGGCPVVNCPMGFACNIDCSRLNACGSVNCGFGKSCQITCSDRTACSTITCGIGPCDIRCTDTDACGTIDCHNSCACDVQCTTIGTQCSGMTCPMGAGVLCTSDGTANSVCRSGQQAGCGNCP